MPYDGEFASYGPLRRIAGNPRVRELVQRCDVAPPRDTDTGLPVPATVLPSGWEPEFVFAIDGSHAEVKVENGYPGAEVSYVTCASVLLLAKRLRELDAQRPIDPVLFSNTRVPAAVDCALPGSNVVLRGMPDARASFRRALYEAMRDTRLAEGGETLLGTYEYLRQRKPVDHSQESPYPDCRPGTRYVSAAGEYACACGCGRPLFSTDALRVHEGMNVVGANGAMFAEVMQVFEQLVLVNTLRFLERQKLLTTLQQIAFVLDGPLAVFGHPAWLSKAIKWELQRIDAIATSQCSTRVLLIGVEKSGFFVDHFDFIDQLPKPEPALGNGRYPPQSVLLLNNDYIRRRILISGDHSASSSQPKVYGADTYYGRKLFYKTRSGARIVATLPFLSKDHENLLTAHPSQYPRLADALSLLDQVVSSRYSHAVSPLIMAHSEAAIPLHLGTQVLQTLAKRLLGGMS